MRRQLWWLNHEGNPIHLPCGGIGVDRLDIVREEIADGRHWLSCRDCDTRTRIPAPSRPAIHPGYQQPRSTYRADLNIIITTAGGAA